MPLEKLEAMTDAELKTYCEPFLRVVSTVTEEKEKEEAENTLVDVSVRKRKSKQSSSSQMWIEEAKRLGTKLGMDVSKLELPAGLETKK